MPTPPTPPKLIRETVELVGHLLVSGDYYLHEREKTDQRSAFEEAARILNITSSTVRHRVGLGSARLGISPEDFKPEPIQSTADLPDPLETLRRHKAANTNYIAQKKTGWIRLIPVRKEPFGIGFVGDPHLDNKGTNLAQLESDLNLFKSAGIRCINIGDMLDNFHHTGKLAAIQAENRVSASEGLSLAEWFIKCGVKWDAHIIGNHDKWAGSEAAHLFSEWAYPTRFYDWTARLIYAWDGGQVSVICSHDFKGSSVHNPLHSLMRRAKDDGTDDVYVAGHRHEWAQGEHENGFRDKRYTFIRARGYKDYDDHAFRHGYASQEAGRSALMTVDPGTGGRMTFENLDEGVEYLQMLKARYIE